MTETQKKIEEWCIYWHEWADFVEYLRGFEFKDEVVYNILCLAEDNMINPEAENISWDNFVSMAQAAQLNLH